MVARGNIDKHRYTYSRGIKAVEESKYGRDMARERYGELKQPDTQPQDRHAPQRLGDLNNLQGQNYRNDTPDNWLRGFGKNGQASAQGKPNFDPGYKGKR